MTTLYLEESTTPIYQRIAHALGRALALRGHEVMLLKPKGFDLQSFAAFVGAQHDAVYVTTHEAGALHMLSPDRARHFFELFPGRIVFVHQDCILLRGDFAATLARLEAYRRVRERSVHLCIEASNVALLQSVGIANARLVEHATEITASPPRMGGWAREAAFVGHVTPPRLPFDSQLDAPLDAWVRARVAERTERPSMDFEPQIETLAKETIGWLAKNDASRSTMLAAQRLWLRAQIGAYTLPARGAVLEAAALDSVTVFGGDPAYLHGVDRAMGLGLPGVTHAAAVYDADALRAVHADSATSLNITSFQFDHAVVNRFHDIVMSGGLCITDARSGLASLTRHHAEVSYTTPSELRDRVRHFSDPRHADQRAALIREMQVEIGAKASYEVLAAEVDAAARGLGE